MLRRLTPTETFILIGALVVAFGLLAFSFVILWINLPPAMNAPLAAITVIPPPTATPQSTPTPSLPTVSEVDGTPRPGALTLGSYVQISGTGGIGLRLRDAPGLSTNLLFLGYDSEVYQVVEGPREVDGRTWYLLVAPYDEKRTGWAVVDYLTIVTPQE
jgi:hypothetical protein